MLYLILCHKYTYTIAHKFVLCLIFLIAGYTHSIAQFVPEYTFYYATNATYPNAAITDFCVDNKAIWCATNIGLIAIDKQTKQITLWAKTDSNESLAPINNLGQDKRNRLWLKTDSKLIIFDKANSWKTYPWERSLGSFNFDSSNILWALDGNGNVRRIKEDANSRLSDSTLIFPSGGIIKMILDSTQTPTAFWSASRPRGGTSFFGIRRLTKEGWEDREYRDPGIAGKMLIDSRGFIHYSSNFGIRTLGGTRMFDGFGIGTGGSVSFADNCGNVIATRWEGLDKDKIYHVSEGRILLIQDTTNILYASLRRNVSADLGTYLLLSGSNRITYLKTCIPLVSSAVSNNDEQPFSAELSPNPASTELSLEITSPIASELSIKIFNQLGSLVADYSGNMVHSGRNTLNLLLENHSSVMLNPGVYFLQIRTKTYNKSLMFVKSP